MKNQLTFQNTTLTVVPHNNQTYITSTDLARALGYSRSDKITQIYTRNQDEFTPEMSLNLKMKVKDYGNGNSEKDVRIFSLRGAHLIAMFSRTKVAKEFRKWVLDILDRETLQISNKISPLAEPEPTYTFELDKKTIHDLVWLAFSHEQMRLLLGSLIKPLEAIGSRYSGAVYGNYTEYQRHYRDCLPLLKNLVAQLKQHHPLEWERLANRLN